MHSQTDYWGAVKNELLGWCKKRKGCLNIFVPSLAPHPPPVTNVKISFSDREDVKKTRILNNRHLHLLKNEYKHVYVIFVTFLIADTQDRGFVMILIISLRNKS